jgi:hypothetical protein
MTFLYTKLGKIEFVNLSAFERMGLSSLNTTNIYNIIPKLKTRDEEKFIEPLMIENGDTILQVINIQPLNFKGQRMIKVELLDATKEQKI